MKIDATYETESKTVIVKTKNETPESTLFVYPAKEQGAKLEILAKLGYTLEKNRVGMRTVTYKEKS
jgi:hypothetical protein